MSFYIKSLISGQFAAVVPCSANNLSIVYYPLNNIHDILKNVIKFKTMHVYILDSDKKQANEDAVMKEQQIQN